MSADPIKQDVKSKGVVLAETRAYHVYVTLRFDAFSDKLNYSLQWTYPSGRSTVQLFEEFEEALKAYLKEVESLIRKSHT